MKRLLLSVIVALSSVLGYAYDFQVDGICYDIISTVDLTCEIVNGSIPASSNLVIPATVTYKNKELKVIGITCAFMNCTSLKKVVLSNNIIEVGVNSFKGCSALNCIVIPESVKTIGKDAFRGCPITSVYVASLEQYLGLGLDLDANTSYNLYIAPIYYLNPKLLVDLVIPSTVTEIKSKFLGCKSIKNVIVEDRDKFLDLPRDFINTPNLNSIKLSRVKVPDNCFKGVKTVDKLKVSEPYFFESVRRNDELNNKSFLVSYGAFPDLESVKKLTLGYFPYRGSYGSDSLRLFGKSVLEFTGSKYVPRYVFTSVSELCMERSSQAKGMFYMKDCGIDVSQCEKITFGENCLWADINFSERRTYYASNSAGDNWASLKTINVMSSTPPNISENYAFKQSLYTDVTLYVPSGSKSQYQQHAIWKGFWDIIEHDWSAIQDIRNEEKVKVSCQGGVLSITNEGAPTNMVVYSITGQVISSKKIDSGLTTIELPTRNIFVLKIGNQSFKIAL